MMSKLFFILILSTGTLHAEVVKPKDVAEPAKGTVKLLNQEYAYEVQDRGWFPAAASENLDTTKSFWFDYKSAKGSLTNQAALKSAVLVDAAVKCAELGQIEYPTQIANLAADLRPTLHTEIMKVDFSVFEDGVTTARIVCQVHVEVNSSAE